MIWRQPIPVKIPQLDGNKFASTVFQLLLIRCANQSQTVYVGNSSIDLTRGQCVVGRNEMAKCFGLKSNETSRIRNILKKLENKYKLITKRKSKNCSIITVIKYDDWVDMTKQTANQRPNKDQSKTTNKNDKNINNLSTKINSSSGIINVLEELGGINI